MRNLRKWLTAVLCCMLLVSGMAEAVVEAVEEPAAAVSEVVETVEAEAEPAEAPAAEPAEEPVEEPAAEVAEEPAEEAAEEAEPVVEETEAEAPTDEAAEDAPAEEAVSVDEAEVVSTEEVAADVECTHENAFSLPGEEVSSVEISGDNQYHIDHIREITYMYCPDCDTRFDIEVDDERECKTEHAYTIVTDGKYVCEQCGHVNTCTHPNVWEEDERWYSDPEYTQVDEEYHIVTGEYYTQDYCPDCFVYLETVNHGIQSEQQEHEWDPDGKCYYCQATNTCSHEHKSSYGYFEDEVYAEEYDMTYEQIPGDNKYHYSIGNWTVVSTCDDCHQYLGSTTEPNHREREQHELDESGKCELCGYTSTCAHQNKDSRVEMMDISAEEIEGDNENHLATGYSCFKVTHCYDCDLMISREYIGEYTEPRRHEYEKNRNGQLECTMCGHVNSCAHEHQEVEEYIYDGDCTEILGDDLYHSVSGRGVKETYCRDCGVSLGREELGNQTREEPHNYRKVGDDLVCEGCGHVNACEHAHVDTWNSLDEDTAHYAPADMRNHSVTGMFYEITYCLDCETEIKKVPIGEMTELWEHRYEDGSNVCTLCDYENTCTHEETYTYEDYDGNDELKFDALDNLYHNVTGNFYNVEVCDICGKTIGRTPIGLGTRKQEHNYNPAGVCYDCGHVNDCQHPNARENGWYDWLSSTEIKGDNLSHNSLADYRFWTYCPDCGMNLTGESTRQETMKQAHDYGNDGVCRDCGHKNTCAHPADKRSAYRYFVYAETNYEDLGDKGHKITGMALEGTYCTLCSMKLGQQELGVMTEIQNHTYFDEDTCSTCGHKNTCQHKNTELRNSYFTYDGTNVYTYRDEQTHTATGIKEAYRYCKDCGSMIGFEGELGSVTGEVQAHDFFLGRCRYCGALEDGIHIQKDGVAVTELQMSLDPKQKTAQLTATGTVTWKSKSTKIATVKNGKVTAVKAGTTEIQALLGKEVVAKVKVTVLGAPSKVTLSKTKETLGVGEALELTATLPKNTGSTLTWKSSKASVVTVNDGVVTAVAPGTAKITVTTYNKKTATCTVTVKAAPTAYKVNGGENLVIGQGMAVTLPVAFEPANAYAHLWWGSTNTDVATVDAAGKVTGIGLGTTVIETDTSAYDIAAQSITVTVTAAPTALTLHPDVTKLGVKETVDLKPEYDGTTKLTYKSSNTKIATVSAAGIVKAVKAGKATITVTTHNGVKATVKITVVAAPSKVTLNKTKATLLIADELALKATLTKGSASRLTWTSSNEAVATVENGKVKAVGAGTATITVKTFNNKKATCKVTVKPEPETMNLSAESVKGLAASMKVKLSPVVTPSGAASTLTWKSSNESVAKIAADGTLETVGAGEVTITVTSRNGLTASQTFTVAAAPTALTLSPAATKIGVGEKINLNATFDGQTKLTYKTANKKIATVSADGTVKGVKAGKVKITVTTHNNIKKTVTITVAAKPMSVKLSKTSATLDEGAELTLKATLSKGSASVLTWETSDATIATVNNGVVKAVGVGTATITVKTYNGKKAICKITVNSTGAGE